MIKRLGKADSLMARVCLGSALGGLLSDEPPGRI